MPVQTTLTSGTVTPVAHLSPSARRRFRSDEPENVRRLLNLIEHVWFGRIEDLIVRDGQPVFCRPPRITRTLKIAGKIDPRPTRHSVSGPLSEEQQRLIDQLRHFGNGLVRRIEIGHGLPLFVEVCDDLPPAA